MPASSAKVKYTQGDVFAIPLPSGGFSIGIVARRHKGIVLAYFFRVRFETPPDLNGIDIDSIPVLTVVKCGDLGIITGRWVRLGAWSNWNPELWPIPLFKTSALVRGQEVAIKFSDDNLIEPSAIYQMTEKELADLTQDQLFGASAAENYVEELLASQN